MYTLLKEYFLNNCGATMVEYALLVALIAFVVLFAAAIFGQNLLAIYETFNI